MTGRPLRYCPAVPAPPPAPAARPPRPAGPARSAGYGVLLLVVLLMGVAPGVAWAGLEVPHRAPGDPRALLAACFVAGGVYHMVLYQQIRRFPEIFWFGLICLLLGLNGWLTGGPLPDALHVPDAYFALLPANFHLILGVFPFFIWTQLRAPLPAAVWVNAALQLGLSLLNLMFGGEGYFEATTPLRGLAALPVAFGCFGVLVVAAVRGDREARVLTFAGLPLFLVVLRDRIVEAQGVVAQGWTTYAFSAFLLGVAINLAGRFSRAYLDLEAREADLKALSAAAMRFVPHSFLRLLGKRDLREVVLGEGIEQEISVLFSDIRSFTSLSERMTPKENFGFINEYLRVMEPCVERAGGFIDKFIGDAVMALFPRGPDDAVDAALGMLGALEAFNAARASRGEAPIEIGVGVNTGTCMLGTIGGPARMDGTVIADAVNLASRVEGLTKRYAARVIVTDATLRGLRQPRTFRELDRVAVKGKSEPVVIYELLDGDVPDEREAKLRTLDRFHEGLRRLRAREFDRAEACFQACLDGAPKDAAAALYLRRCAALRADDPGPGWDGVIRMDEK